MPAFDRQRQLQGLLSERPTHGLGLGLVLVFFGVIEFLGWVFLGTPGPLLMLLHDVHLFMGGGGVPVIIWALLWVFTTWIAASVIVDYLSGQSRIDAEWQRDWVRLTTEYDSTEEQIAEMQQTLSLLTRGAEYGWKRTIEQRLGTPVAYPEDLAQEEFRLLERDFLDNIRLSF